MNTHDIVLYIHTSSLEMFCQYGKAFCPREKMVLEDGQALVPGVLAPSLVLLRREPSTLTEYAYLQCECECVCFWGGGVGESIITVYS